MEELYKILGSKKWGEKYKSILPMLWLMTYRIMRFPGKDRIFVYDGVYPSVLTYKSYLAFPIKCIKYFLNNMLHRMKWEKKKTEKVLFSDTFWASNRYEDLHGILEKNEHVIGTYSVQDCYLPLIDKKYRTGINRKRNDIKRLPLGISVVTWENKKNIEKCYDFLLKLVSSDKTCDDFEEEAEKLFSALQETCEENIKRVSKVIKRYNIKKFVTLQQSNAKDYICIMACRKLGIHTLELLHCTRLFMDIRSYNCSQFQFADEVGFWCEEDKIFYERHVERFFDFWVNKCKYGVYGSPELVADKVIEICRDYETKRNITFMIPSSAELQRNALVDVKNPQMDDYRKVKKQIYDGIFRLSRKYPEAKVYLRYHPNTDCQYKEMDREIINKYGFIVSEDTLDGLKVCLSESSVVIGVASSALYLANTYGCAIYAIDFGVSRLDFCGMKNIETIEVSKIDSISVTKKGRIKEEQCIDVKKLLMV